VTIHTDEHADSGFALLGLLPSSSAEEPIEVPVEVVLVAAMPAALVPPSIIPSAAVPDSSVATSWSLGTPEAEVTPPSMSLSEMPPPPMPQSGMPAPMPLFPELVPASAPAPIPLPFPAEPAEAFAAGFPAALAGDVAHRTRRQARLAESDSQPAVTGLVDAEANFPAYLEPSFQQFASRTPDSFARSARETKWGVNRRNRIKPPRISMRASSPAKRGSSKLLSLGAMLFAGALLVGTSVPANAFMGDSTAKTFTGAAPSTFNTADSQSLAVSTDAVGAATARDGYTVISYSELLRLRYGNRSYSFTATNGAVRWPFPYAVPISDGWGDRVAPCYGCSSFHKGVDFTPGSGTPIYAIADGVVSVHDDAAYGFGNHVEISHVINGQSVDSLYAHMQHGSSPLNAGDTIKVGDFIGLVGDTGASTGAHLHFEIHPDGVPVDPFAWLQAHAVN
jgi:murein DD-endopeptidase MepM/ murein hydrolase activator NlpD